MSQDFTPKKLLHNLKVPMTRHTVSQTEMQVMQKHVRLIAYTFPPSHAEKLG